MKNKGHTDKKRAYRPFAIAAIVYTIGVVVFSIWACRSQKQALLADTDQRLRIATYAAREILSDAYAAGLTQIENIEHKDYIDYQQRLTRFAIQSGYIAIGAIAQNDDQISVLICGSGNLDALTLNDICMGSSTPLPVEKVINTIPKGISESQFFVNTQPHGVGPLRISFLYLQDADGNGIAYTAVQKMDDIHVLLNAQITRNIFQGLFLLIMVIPMVALYSRVKKRTAQKLTEMNTHLLKDADLQKKREADLTDAINDLERFTNVASGRESRIIELKQEVNELLDETKKPRRYSTNQTD